MGEGSRAGVRETRERRKGSEGPTERGPKGDVGGTGW